MHNLHRGVHSKVVCLQLMRLSSTQRAYSQRQTLLCNNLDINLYNSLRNNASSSLYNNRHSSLYNNKHSKCHSNLRNRQFRLTHLDLHNNLLKPQLHLCRKGLLIKVNFSVCGNKLLISLWKSILLVVHCLLMPKFAQTMELV